MKKHLSLIVAVSIPILMIIFVALSISLPRLFVKPQVKFVYATQYTNDVYQNHYQVSGGKLVQVPARDGGPSVPPAPKSVTAQSKLSYPTLYLYDAVTDSSKEITFAEAQSYTLDSNVSSPEGYTVTQGNTGGGVFEIFGGYTNDYNSWYLKNGTYSKKINIHIEAPNQYYYGDFGLIGWVIPDNN